MMKTRLSAKPLLMCLLFILSWLAFPAVWADDQSSCGNGPRGSDNKPIRPPGPVTTKGDPVDMSAGTLVSTVTDMTVPGVMPIVFTRSFNSGMDYNGLVGWNWDCTFDQYLDFESKNLYYSPGTGSKVKMTYTSSDNSTAVAYSPQYYTMTTNSSGQHVITDRFGNQKIFDGESNEIVIAQDRNGNQLTYAYDGLGGLGTNSGRLLKVEDAVHGHYVTLNYGTDYNYYYVSSIQDQSGRTVSYAQTTGGGLNPSGKVVFNLTQVTTPTTPEFPTGTTFTYICDWDLRITSEVDGKGNTILTNAYCQGKWGQHLIQSQTVNGQTNSFYYDGFDTYPHTPIVSGTGIGYATDIKDIKYTDFKGQVTKYTPDSNGNITQQIVYTTGAISGEPAS
jgi:hypothetical protein